MADGIWSGRETGSSQLSVGTHLAMETLFGDQMFLFDEKREFEKVDVNQYEYHVFNIYTLCRNILNSTPYKNKEDLIRDKKFVHILAFEAELIKDFYKNTKCKAILFYPDYRKVYSGFNIGKEEWDIAPRTEHLLIQSAIAKMEQKTKIVSCNDGKGYKLPEDLTRSKMLITTHVACDMLNKHKIDLLESHTGKVRTKSELYTKYHKLGKQDLSHLPFTQTLLYLLGDKLIIRPLDLKIRRQVLDASIKFNWNVKTTNDKIEFNLRMIPELRDWVNIYKKLY